ncbi:MBL fold metallo-hydrolase [Clostridium estertheticum]|uniref:MBL fold metallo-hydrolase n=1 Tax=Clostridium estertheticum TaxID=238834 RepID=A0A5N7IVL8_9CLOT|nr:MBL fold metallo-hydrolase RNA specificity domain-containing protein [Clostridium estertheticum]MPQ29850.1 MBL fold metallo-hydrolase [Clostridium estertheticum]MPQ60526.1 MBL fold metallo-hydrolase [Clostridium estertheticum]
MKLSFLGGAYEIGASCILFKIDNKNILMDSGIRQSASKDPLPDFRTIQEMGGVDAIIISHAHLDHIGSLPMISKEYPNARVYMNNMTKDLVRVLLYDSLKIMNNRDAEIPLYAQVDVEDMLNRIFTINYEVDFEIFDYLKLTFYNAGHIAGASCVYLQGSEGSLFYSGDFSLFSQKSVEGAKIPRLRPDIGIFESTYADKLHSNREIEENRLIDIVSDCINTNGKMIIPAFALGRAQEVILILKKAMNSKKLKKVNIYIDGMVNDINRVYKFNPLYLKNTLGKKVLKGLEPFYDDNIIQVKNKEQREAILVSEDSCVIISSSGMLTGGPSQYYAQKIAALENGYIVITGYQDEESPGRKLLNLLETDKEDRVLEINGKIIPVKCRVERVGLSAHGDKSEIQALIAKLSPDNVFLVHGDSEVINTFAKEAAREIRGKLFAPKSGEGFDIEVKAPRRQLSKQIPFVMKSKNQLNKENFKLLWSFVREKYMDKFFTIEELTFIWSGTKILKALEVDNFRVQLLDSPYFESDLRRLFLFKARTPEDVTYDLLPKSLKANEITDLVSENLSSYEYKKLGLNQEERKAILYFDFPKTIDKSIHEVIKTLEGKTGWKIEINDQMNLNSSDKLIRNLLKEADIKKISCHLNENKIIVTLKSFFEITTELEDFKHITGVDLLIQSEGNILSNSKVTDNSSMFSEYSTAPLEQNKAFELIDEAFMYEEFKPYKKSIKNNHIGKYIELTFISPVVGKKYFDILEKLSEILAWNIIISTSVNQNAIINLVLQLCDKNDVKLKKNPAFNETALKVSLKCENIDDVIFLKIKETFEHNTGCTLALG